MGCLFARPIQNRIVPTNRPPSSGSTDRSRALQPTTMPPLSYKPTDISTNTISSPSSEGLTATLFERAPINDSEHLHKSNSQSSFSDSNFQVLSMLQNPGLSTTILSSDGELQPLPVWQRPENNIELRMLKRKPVDFPPILQYPTTPVKDDNISHFLCSDYPHTVNEDGDYIHLSYLEFIKFRKVYTGILLDDCITDEQGREQFKVKLNKYIDVVLDFYDVNACINFIMSRPTDHYILVASPVLGKGFVQTSYQLAQLEMVFIYGNDLSLFDSEQQRDVEKNISYYNNENLLFNAIVKFMRRLYSLSVYILDKNKTPQISLRHFDNAMDRFSILSKPGSFKNYKAKFYLHQLILDAILRITDRNDAKMEMIRVCRYFYRDKPAMLEKIDEFDKTYVPNDAVKWYTRPTFIYILLNSAIRTENMDALFFFRLILADLHFQLLELHANESHNISKTLYRGQSIRKEEFLQLQAGLVISFNGFLSTSENKETAVLFIEHTTEQIYAVLWKIKLPNEKTKLVYADISSLSYVPDESEVLFSIGSQFQIETIEQVQGETYITITLVPYVEVDHSIIDRYTFLKNNLDAQSPVLALCTILLSLGEYEKVERLCKRLLLKLPDHHSELSAVYRNLGAMYNEIGQFDQAFASHLKAATIEQNRFFTDLDLYGPELAIKRKETVAACLAWVTSMVHLALLHAISKNYDPAISLLKKCHRWIAPLELDDSPIYGPIIAKVHLATGRVFGAIKHFLRVHESFLRAWSISTECGDKFGCCQSLVMRGDAYVQLGGNDPIPENDESFGNLDYAAEDYKFSLYLAFEMVAADDPCMLPAYEGIGNVCMLKGDNENALAHFEMCRDILMGTSTIAHARLIVIYSKLGFVYSKLDQQILSLENWTNACNVLIDQPKSNTSYGHNLNETKEFVLNSYAALREELEGQKFLNQYFKYLFFLMHFKMKDVPFARMTMDDFKAFVDRNYCVATETDGTKFYILFPSSLISYYTSTPLIATPHHITDEQVFQGAGPTLQEIYESAPRSK